MREIKFRGKRIDNGEWVYGFYHESDHPDHKGKGYIIPSCASALYSFEVDPETVGQYTGLLDKRGNKLFEGDIVRKLYSEFLDSADCSDPLKIGDEYAGGKVVEMEIEEDGWMRLIVGGLHDVVTLNRFRFWLKKEDFGYEGEELQSSDDYEVIGNLYDNPELLGEVESNG
ncbi:YopX family protein [Paenibacillus senegalimassiliensis]|uniref:YopX family protein n=1 Tax=Paenibacillus senegalimassiliensis TaxID=1737426 RepID=UPI00073F2D54|nr:YopX family protein [Paenibacillus senegalimassiliensis]